MRLIDADALIMHFADWELQESPYWGANGYGDITAYETIKQATKAIEDAPTIDAVEVVRHGHWKAYQDDPVRYEDRLCSECDFAVWSVEAERYSYCPNCGAKMDGGDNE